MPQEKKEVETVFRKVSVKERTPKKNCVVDTDLRELAFRMMDEKFVDGLCDIQNPEHWYEASPLPTPSSNSVLDKEPMNTTIEAVKDEVAKKGNFSTFYEILLKGKNGEMELVDVEHYVNEAIELYRTRKSQAYKEELLRWIEEKLNEHTGADEWDVLTQVKTKILSLPTQQK